MNNILIIYDYFYPAYKAGGPVQSLTNLITTIQDQYNISVITGATDLNGEETLPGIKTDTWVSTQLPGTKKAINCWYASNKVLSKAVLKREIGSLKPAVVYLNGMFSYKFLILPLLSIDKRTTKLVLCPRGMLQPGALSGKSFKKKIYLFFLKNSGLVKNVTWHATNEEEQKDIKKIFGKNAQCIVAPNIPKRPVAIIKPSEKVSKKIRLVYLSLITEKKNLYGLLKIIIQAGNEISLDIYGPVKDNDYWEKCKEFLKNNPGSINYRGDARPENVQELFSQYDASILLTKGENFGHALYESLSAGRPVITSHFTPWNDLEEKKAGWNVDINDQEAVVKKIGEIVQLDNAKHQLYCEGAFKIARDYYSNGDFANSYNKLFSI